MDINILKELGEWAAIGFYEGIELPFPRSFGLAYRRMYENMPIAEVDNNYLTPHEPLYKAQTYRSHQRWFAASMILNFTHVRSIQVNGFIAAEKKEQFPQHAEFIDNLVEDLNNRIKHFGGYTHTNPDIRRIVDDGFLAMEQELNEELTALNLQGDAADQGELNLLLSLKDYAEGVKAFHTKSCAAAQKSYEDAPEGETKTKLKLIADALPDAFLKPASTFLQGLLAVNMLWMLDGCDSIGRVDQALGQLFDRDMDSGALDIAFVRELLDEWFLNFETMNGWNLQIGGYTPQGEDGCNRLTEELILAAQRQCILRPNLAFRVTKKTPDDLLIKALKAISNGSGRPALYNDDLYIKTLLEMDLGLTEEDAREIGFGGCTETMIAGLSNVGSLEGTINLAQCLQLALYDGYDPVQKKQTGPHTGKLEEFKQFDEFLYAVKRQIQYATDAFVSHSRDQLTKRFTDESPKLHRTLFTRDCVKNRKSFEAGGARYNWAVVTYQGVANLIDSVAAVQKLVFGKDGIPGAELMKALKENFEGHESLRQRILALPKYGNDDATVDSTGKVLIEFAWKELISHETPRGGRYLPSVILFWTYTGAGKLVAATPDGRKAFDALTDSVGAAQGRDLKGPTALLSSAAKLPLNLAVGSPVLNVRLSKDIFAEEENLKRLASLIRSFFAEGGMQLQFSVISSDEMKAAQADPEKYKNLIVRIGGFSAYFTGLDKELQDTIISRTEHGL